MSNKAIGIFDSGVGGLTVMKEIRELLPNENIIYFGDTARLPYGEKSPETIIRYSVENAQFLIEQDIKVLVVACNTASAFAINKLNQILDIPVLGVIVPGAEKACSVTQNKRIAVLGTKATIKSGIYQKEIEKNSPGCYVCPIACPLFVPLVEENFISHPATQMIIKEYLSPIQDLNIDTLLLGCTHYPLLKEMIQAQVGDAVRIVDSASICAKKLKSILNENHLENLSGNTFLSYYVSDDKEKFAILGERIFGNPIPEVFLYKKAGEKIEEELILH